MRGRAEIWGTWAFDNWRFLLVPPFLTVISILFIYSYLNDDPDLSERSRRTKIFWELQDEMKTLEIPPNSTVVSTDADQKAGSILISTGYRTSALESDFFEYMNGNLIKRGWISCQGYEDGSAARSVHYCRGKQEAHLYLKRKGLFDSDPGQFWELIFAVR